jgi:hypothetical protein
MGHIASAGLTQTDALRLGRVIRALTAAGLIDECYVFVGSGRLIEGETFATRIVDLSPVGGVRPPRAPRRSPAAGALGSARRP